MTYLVEGLTILCVTAIAIVTVKVTNGSTDGLNIALSVASGLIGYIAKSGVDFIRKESH